MERVIVERRFEQPIDIESIVEAVERNRACYEGHRVTYLGSWLSLDGLRVICEYEAPDAESVRIAIQRAGAPFERIWTAVRVTPG